MSDSFTHVDTYPTLAVSVNEPTDHFQLDTNTTTPSEYNSSDPSPIESRSHASQWNTDLFPNEFLDGSWSNPLDQQQQSPLPQSSAQQFWSASQNSTALAYQSQGGGVGGGSSLDYSRAIAAVSAAAGVTQSSRPSTAHGLPGPNPAYGFDNAPFPLEQQPSSQQGFNSYQSGLFVDTSHQTSNQQLEHTFHQQLSRQSSHSSFTSMSNDGFASTSNEGLYDLAQSMGHDSQNRLLPPFQQTPTAANTYSGRHNLPPKQVNAFSTPGKMGRPRSLSRINPYTRHGRSTSISTVGSYDGVTPYSFQPSTLSSPQRGLSNGLNKMSLHHRRTSSKTSNYGSPIKKQPSRSVLSRPNRSASMSVLRASDSTPYDFSDHQPMPRDEIQTQDSLKQEAMAVQSIVSSAQQDKARSAWVRHWLQLSYSREPNDNVPRQGLYHSYCLSSDDYGLKPINAASFGKAVRAAFPGIRTRRLGVRGNSKYHYVSLRPALVIEAQRLNDYGGSNGSWHPHSHGFQFRSNGDDGLMSMDMEQGEEMDDEDFDDNEEDEVDDFFPVKKSLSSLSLSHAVRSHRQSGSDDYSSRSSVTIRPRLGMLRRHPTSVAPSPPALPQRAPTTTQITNLPNYPQWEEVMEACPGHIEEARFFWQGFQHHQQELIGCIERQSFDDFEDLCRRYWFNGRHGVCQAETMSKLVHRAMAVSYDHMIGKLLGQADSMSKPSQESLRALARSLEESMEVSFSNFDLDFKSEKLALSRHAARLMQRVAELSLIISSFSNLDRQAAHLASAWHSLNIDSIIEQSTLALECGPEMIQKVLGDFGSWLDFLEEMASRQHVPGHGVGQSQAQSQVFSQKAIRKLTSWLDTILAHSENHSIDSLSFKCTFITSQVMRAFTLESDPNFGAFQLLKTFVDDYISIASARHVVFAAEQSDSDDDQDDSLVEIHQGLSVGIPRMGDGTFGSDPATAVPAFRTQEQVSSGNLNVDGHIDPSLLSENQRLDNNDNDHNLDTFSFMDQQPITPRPMADVAMQQFLPKTEQ